MLTFDEVTFENTQKNTQDTRWLWTRKSKCITQFLISQQSNIDKIFLYAKDSLKSKYHYLRKDRDDVGLKHFEKSKSKCNLFSLVNYYSGLLSRY